jgi:hypothetical protein
MTFVNVMPTQRGNELVQRIVDAAYKMMSELDATPGQADAFIRREMTRLGSNPDYAMAGTSIGRCDAFYALHAQ